MLLTLTLKEFEALNYSCLPEGTKINVIVGEENPEIVRVLTYTGEKLRLENKMVGLDIREVEEKPKLSFEKAFKIYVAPFVTQDKFRRNEAREVLRARLKHTKPFFLSKRRGEDDMGIIVVSINPTDDIYDVYQEIRLCIKQFTALVGKGLKIELKVDESTCGDYGIYTVEINKDVYKLIHWFLRSPSEEERFTSLNACLRYIQENHWNSDREIYW